MEKIIYNNKLKKLFISFAIIILLFEYMIPLKVYGEEGYKTQSYNEWIAEQGDEQVTSPGAFNPVAAQKAAINSGTMSKIEKEIYEDIINDKERENKAKKLLEDRGNNLQITGKIITSYENASSRVPTYKFDIKELKDDELTIEELRNWGMEESGEVVYKYNEFKDFIEEQDDDKVKEILREPLIKYISSELPTFTDYDKYINIILSKYRDTIEITVKGDNKDNYEIIGINIPGLTKEQLLEDTTEEIEEDSMDAGGILMAPLFWMINLISDSFTSMIGRLMTGEGPATAIGILQLSPETERMDEANAVKVSVKSFLGGYQYPHIVYSPEEIFSGKVDLLSIDFISGKNFSGDLNTDKGWRSIRKVISEWYKVIRMIAIIGLLSVLIYTGIKIIISANAKDKAKYKEWIINWFMAVAILFSMHIIMSFVISVTGEINKLLDNSCGTLTIQTYREDKDDIEATFTTNLIGYARFMVQSEKASYKIGYEVIYIALLVYTFKFTFIYLKRVLNMAFLTLIAPIVALTYPIDKINDGKAQGFDMWLKEYIFNALLQPMHYLMYYILVGASINIAASNPIYGIAVLAFMTEAEKLLKKIFGFDKASQGTVGGLGGAFAAGALASNIKNIARMAKLPTGNGGKGGTENAGKDNALNSPKPTERPDMDEFDKDFGNDGGEDRHSRRTPTTRDDDENKNENKNKTDAQKMFEADEENGEFDDDPTYREAMARDAYGQNSRNMDDGMSDEEYREHLRDEQGMDDETIELAMAARRGGQQQGSQQNNNSRTPNSNTTTPAPQPKPASSITPSKKPKSVSATPIRKMARGLGAVGKRLAKPVWDADHGRKYNTKRLVRNVARIGLGAGVGIAAAAVQAGISITDGKYSPMEGIATFGAGFVGGNQIAKGIESLGTTFMDGATEGDKKAQMKRAQARFADREDVIAFNKREYATKEEREEMVKRQRDHFLPGGITDLNEMKRCAKYANTLVDPKKGITQEDADRRAVAAANFKKTLKDQGQTAAIYDADKQKKYIDSMVAQAASADKDKVRRQYERAFAATQAFDKANK